jgi:hypothetical protein
MIVATRSTARNRDQPAAEGILGKLTVALVIDKWKQKNAAAEAAAG